MLAAVVLLVAAVWCFGRSSSLGARAGSVVGDAASGDVAGGDVAGVGLSGGFVAEGETVSIDDESLPAIARLDSDLLEALRAAAGDAAQDGVELRVASGWRSAAYQQRLLDEATATLGADAARRQVLPPERSRHVTGDAVDVGPSEASVWLRRHGSEHGLCQVYANEPWHFELVTAPGAPCPPMRADASS